MDPVQLDNVVVSETCVVHDPAARNEGPPSGEHCTSPAGPGYGPGTSNRSGHLAKKSAPTSLS